MVVRGMSLAHSLPVAIVEKPVAFNQDLKALVPNPDVDGEYILRWLQANQSTLLLLATEASHGTKRIPTGDLLATHVSLPRRAEQREITGALSDVDELLRTLDALIAKKRVTKQATMQQLLTGRIRLSGFSEKWQTKRMGSIGLSYGGLSGKKKGDFGNGSALYLTFLSVLENIILNSSHTNSVHIVSGETQNLVAKGDLLFNGTSEMPSELAMAAVMGQQIDNLYLNSFCFGFRIHERKKYSPLYLAYFFRSSEGRTIVSALAQGATRHNISKRQFLGLKLTIPSYCEQRAIVDILSDMDAEIVSLEKRRDKICAIERGMMQTLLTGRIRLVVSQKRRKYAAVLSSVAKQHNWQFNEAVVISVLARYFGTEQYPLGRMRYTKLLYLFHRHKEGYAEDYLQKAAGPYNPRNRYGGPERIALEKAYIRKHESGKFQGFVAGSHVREAEEYFGKWYGKEALQWLDQFRYRKNDELELLTTVDMAAVELLGADKEASVENVKKVILGHQEWKAKIDRRIFSDANLSRAIDEIRALFSVSSERDTA